MVVNGRVDGPYEDMRRAEFRSALILLSEAHVLNFDNFY